MDVLASSRRSGVPLEELLERSDFVSLHCPLTPATRHLINTEALARMRPHAILINTARGPVVDEEALARALAEGRLGGAVLDVFTTEPLPVQSPFWSLPNVIVTPHNSGFRAGHFDAVIDLFSENLTRFWRGVDLLNVVDLNAGY